MSFFLAAFMPTHSIPSVYRCTDLEDVQVLNSDVNSRLSAHVQSSSGEIERFPPLSLVAFWSRVSYHVTVVLSALTSVD